MKTSSDEFYINGEYLKHNQTWGLEDVKWKANAIYKLLKKNNTPVSNIVDVGCGSGGILEELAQKDLNIQTLTGYDISPDAFDIATKRQTGKVSFVNADYTQTDFPPVDLLLAIDVIEHVDDFYGFLRKLKERSNHFVFHIPLDLCCRSIIKPHILLQQREAVGHIHYFTKEMALWFLKDTGYTIIDFVYTMPEIDVDPPRSFKQFVKKQLRRFSFFINKELSIKLWGGYSMMILLK